MANLGPAGSSAGNGPGTKKAVCRQPGRPRDTSAAICSGCGRPTDECCVGDGCVPVEDQEQPLVAADGVEPVPGSPVHAPVAAYEVKCACGNITAVVQEPMKLNNLRCWLCPKDNEPKRPTLTLVRP